MMSWAVCRLSRTTLCHTSYTCYSHPICQCWVQSNVCLKHSGSAQLLLWPTGGRDVGICRRGIEAASELWGYCECAEVYGRYFAGQWSNLSIARFLDTQWYNAWITLIHESCRWYRITDIFWRRRLWWCSLLQREPRMWTIWLRTFFFNIFFIQYLCHLCFVPHVRIKYIFCVYTCWFRIHFKLSALVIW